MTVSDPESSRAVSAACHEGGDTGEGAGTAGNEEPGVELRSPPPEPAAPPPRSLDASARALAANLTAFSSKRHSATLGQRPRGADRSSARTGQEGGAPGSGPRRHDFRRPSLLSEQQIRALDSFHRRYADEASGALASMVRGRARVDLTEVRQCSYFDFICSLRNPTSLQLVYSTPGKHSFVAEITPEILFPILDRLLGWRGEDSTFRVRTFTRIEAPLVGHVFQRLLDVLAECWSRAGAADEDSIESTGRDIRFDVRESEHNPLLMQVFCPAEPTVVIEFQLALSSATGSLRLCLPATPFESILDRLAQSSTLCPRSLASEEERRESLRKRLEDNRLTLAAELPAVPIALEDLLRLRPGDMIDTELPSTCDVAVRVGGGDVFRGHAVTQSGRSAVRVTGFHHAELAVERAALAVDSAD